MSDTATHVISLPIRRGQRSCVAKGSVRRPCSTCASSCWVGPGSQRAMANGVKLICLDCYEKLPAVVPFETLLHTMPLLPGQRAELFDALVHEGEPEYVRENLE